MAKLQLLLAGLYAASAFASPRGHKRGWDGPDVHGDSTSSTEGGEWGYSETTTCKAHTVTETKEASTVYRTQKASTVSRFDLLFALLAGTMI